MCSAAGATATTLALSFLLSPLSLSHSILNPIQKKGFIGRTNNTLFFKMSACPPTPLVSPCFVDLILFLLQVESQPNKVTAISVGVIFYVKRIVMNYKQIVKGGKDQCLMTVCDREERQEVPT